MTTTFSDLPIIPEIQSALKAIGYEIPTPIQAGAIPPLLEGKDLLGCAQTGTGKTAAFSIPILQHLHVSKSRANPFEPHGLILAPTRELVVQISENFAAIGKKTRIKHACIYGGVGQRPQVAALTQGVHVLVATPGRLLDLVDQQYCKLGNVEYFVLDEADRMLDMGFMPEIQRLIRLLPKKKQSIFLSATMPAPIKSLASALLHEHVTVMVAPPSTTAERVEQKVMFVDKENKRKLLDRLLAASPRERILVFMRTKHGADRMYKALITAGVKADGIHGGRSQNARQRVLNAFKNGEINVLVATDVAARGIDIDNIALVINYEVPQDAENYVHRIGRTARAGADGKSITFCEGDEFKYLQEVQKTIGKKIEVDRDHPFHSSDAEDEELREIGNSIFTRQSPKGRNQSAARRTANSTTKGGAKGGRDSNRVNSSSGDEAQPRGEVTRRRSISGKVKKITSRPAKKKVKYASPYGNGKPFSKKKKSSNSRGTAPKRGVKAKRAK